MKNIHIAKNPLIESTHDILPGGANRTLVLMMRENESASGWNDGLCFGVKIMMYNS
jgi:hypothetical protein